VAFDPWYVLPAAFLLDLMAGDPESLPHPIRWMGRAASCLEPRFRKIPAAPFVSGLLFSLFLIGSAYVVTAGIIVLARRVDPALAAVFSILFVYYSISIRSLEEAALRVYRALKKEGLPAGRKEVSAIVGRDVGSLSETGVSSAAVESVAENLVDGVISPIVYAALGGAPLAMAFKMASTLDSMIGYKNERYRLFGKAAARIDDGLNFLPARLSIPVIALSARILFGEGKTAFKTAVLEGANHTSPNAGYPEACFAGALRVKLNGPGTYGGIRVEKPFLGTAFGRPDAGHIRKACDLMILSAFFSLAAVVVLKWILGAMAGAANP
jgi:adenosylcobinamide-phosphate synthase